MHATNATGDSTFTVIDIPARISPDLLESYKNKYLHFIREYGADYVLNMEKVEHLFSTTLALIMHIFNAVILLNGSLSMVNVSKQVAVAMRFMKIDEKIPVFSSVEDYEFERLTAAPLHA